MDTIFAMIQSMEGPTDELEPLIKGSVAITARAIAAAGVDLSFQQWRVLVVVGDSPDGGTVSEIAERIGATLSAASRLVGRLERRGLVRATKDEHDRRATRVTLSEAGSDLRNQVMAKRRQMAAEILADAVLGLRDRSAISKLARSFGRFV